MVLTSTIDATSQSLSQAELIERARLQDENAVIALIEFCEARISAAIQIAGVSRYSPDFADAQNQALFEIWRQFPTLRKGQAVCYWMHGIARRVSASRIIDPLIRQRSRQDKLQRSQPADAGMDLADAVAERDLLGRVLNDLSEEHCEVLVLRYLEGFSEDEVARLLRIPVKTVSSRTSRAKRAALELANAHERNGEKS